MKNLKLLLVLLVSLIMISCENTDITPDQMRTDEFEVYLGNYVAENFVIDGEVYTSADDYCTNYDDSGYLDIWEFEIYDDQDYELEFDKNWICSEYGIGTGFIKIIDNTLEFNILDGNNEVTETRIAYVVENNEEITKLRWDENTSDAIEITYKKE